MTAQTHIQWRHPSSQALEDAPCSETVHPGTETVYPLQGNDLFQVVEKCLSRKALLKLVGNHCGERISCLHGVLWITQSGNPEDIFVCAGESFTITQPGILLIEGLAESRLKIAGLSARSGWHFLAKLL